MSPWRFCPQCGQNLLTRPEGGRDRLACSDASCGYVFWDNPVPVVAGLVEHGSDVILIQNHGWPANWWGLVTGFLESGETPAEGIVREVDEELGLAAELVNMIGIYPFFQLNQLILAYHLRAQGPITLGSELAGYKAVPISKLRPWPQATGQAVADWLAARQS